MCRELFLGFQPFQLFFPFSINYGNFINTALDFLIIAFSIFLFVKLINSMKRKEETKPTPPPAPSKEEQLLTEIRDLLKGKNCRN